MASKKKIREETVEEMEAALSPESKRIVRILDSALTATTPLDYEAILASHDRQADDAWRRLTVTMRNEFRKADEERKKLWGKKFPRYVGEKPPKPEPEDSKKPKTARKPAKALLGSGG